MAVLLPRLCGHSRCNTEAPNAAITGGHTALPNLRSRANHVVHLPTVGVLFCLIHSALMLQTIINLSPKIEISYQMLSENQLPPPRCQSRPSKCFNVVMMNCMDIDMISCKHGKQSNAVAIPMNLFQLQKIKTNFEVKPPSGPRICLAQKSCFMT